MFDRCSIFSMTSLKQHMQFPGYIQLDLPFETGYKVTDYKVNLAIKSISSGTNCNFTSGVL